MQMGMALKIRMGQSLVGDFANRCLPKTARWLQSNEGKPPASICPFLNEKIVKLDILDAIIASFPAFRDQVLSYHRKEFSWQMYKVYSRRFLDRIDDIILKKLKYAVKVADVNKEDWEYISLNTDFYS